MREPENVFETDIVEQARRCSQNPVKDREEFKDVLENIEALLRNSFEVDDYLSDNSYEKAIDDLISSTHALGILIPSHRFKLDELKSLIQLAIDMICINNDECIATNFHYFLNMVVRAGAKLSDYEYDLLIQSILEVVKYCCPHNTRHDKSGKLLEVMSAKVLAKLETDRDMFFQTYICFNLLESIFNKSFHSYRSSTVYHQFFPTLQIILRNSLNFGILLKVSLTASHQILCLDRSPFEQIKLLEEMFKSIISLNLQNENRETITDIFAVVSEFLVKYNDLLITKKELRDKVINWVELYLQIISDTEDHYNALGSFATIMVNMSTSLNNPDTSKTTCLNTINICLKRIKVLVATLVHTKTMSKSVRPLTSYLDILASEYQLSKVQKNDVFDWIDHELNELMTMENADLCEVLTIFVLLQHPSCQKYFKKYIPSIDKLWIRIRKEERLSDYVLRLACLISSCPFVDSDVGKQILSILLIPCYKDIRETYKNKYDNHRLCMGKSMIGSVAVFSQLDQFVPIMNEEQAETAKLRSVFCALQIEQKSNQLMPLIVDMAVSMIMNAKSRRITFVLPAVLNFVEENYIHGDAFVNCLMNYLSTNGQIFNEKIIRLVVRTIRQLLCIFANRGDTSDCCSKSTYVKPNENNTIEMNTLVLESIIQLFLNNYKNYKSDTVKEHLILFRSIMIHSKPSNALRSALRQVLKSLDLAFTSNSKEFILFWESVENNSGTNDEYIEILMKAVDNKTTNLDKIDTFLKYMSNSKLPTIIKVLSMASIFAHASVMNNQSLWNIINNWMSEFANEALKDKENATNEERLQSFLNRYSSIFTRSFVHCLLISKNDEEEMEMREILRGFATRIYACFKIPNLTSTMDIIRPTLLFWSLGWGGTDRYSRKVCNIIDFLCQELAVASTSTSALQCYPNNMNAIKSQRRSLITEVFPLLLQLWRFENFEGHKNFWKFCEEHCEFPEELMSSHINAYRKSVFSHVLVVAAEDFIGKTDTPHVTTLKSSYANLNRERQFSLTSAIEHKNEETELILMFRKIFTSDEYFWLRERAANSLQIIIKTVSGKFFEKNWWTLLLALRYSPPKLRSTLKSWFTFIDQVPYDKLRNNLWRIVTDVSRVENPSEILERLWTRLNYSSYEKTMNDSSISKLFWILPDAIITDVSHQTIIKKSRSFGDVLDIIRQFDRYPTTLFVDHLKSKIEHGLVWKTDYPKLISELTKSLIKCENINQKNAMCSLLDQFPIITSDLADCDFTRWDMTASFYLNASDRTPSLIEECLQLVEKTSSSDKLDYLDKTICELSRFVLEPSSSPNFDFECLMKAYKNMNVNCKPEPRFIDFNENTRIDSFSKWLTMLIRLCISSDDSDFASFVSISHIDDEPFLTKLLTKFMIHAITKNREVVVQTLLTEFEKVLNTAYRRRITKLDVSPAAFVFYIHEFLYYFMNLQSDKPSVWKPIQAFWIKLMKMTINDENGRDVPLVVKVAEKLGMEKRCIAWMEMYMELKMKDGKVVEKQDEAAYFFTLMNLYARSHELNGVRGAYTCLSKIQVDHVPGKICYKEAYGNTSEALPLSQMIIDKHKPFDPCEYIKKEIDDLLKSDEINQSTDETERYCDNLRNLMKWTQVDKDFGESPHVFSKTIESKSVEVKLLTMIKEGESNETIDLAISQAKQKVFQRLEDPSIGGYCSYATSTPYLVQLCQFDEMTRLKDAKVEELLDVDSELWKSLEARIENSEQRLDVIEPILRVRRSVLDSRMKLLPDREKKEKQKLKSKVVESHLLSAQIARLHGCRERALLSIYNAKKVLPCDNKIVLEEAKLQLQTSDEQSGMNLLKSILTTTFFDLSKHYGDTQQESDLNLRLDAEKKLKEAAEEEKNLFSSVQMLKISHMIKAGNTTSFKQLLSETTRLLNAFVSSGVMYEAAWYLDYLHQFHDRNNALPVLKAYTQVAKYEKNPVLQARAVERMTSLWLKTASKIRETIDSNVLNVGKKNDLVSNIDQMGCHMKHSLMEIGHRAFYPAYAVLARNIDHKDPNANKKIKSMMVSMIAVFPHQCMWQSVYLLRAKEHEKQEKYKEVLETVRDKDQCYASVINQYDYASFAFNEIFDRVTEKNAKLSEVVPQLDTLIRKRKYEPRNLLSGRNSKMEESFTSGIMIPLRSEIDGSVQMTKLNRENSVKQFCEIDERYQIFDYQEKITILESLTKPVIIEMITMTGKKVRLICKGKDDLTKDYHFSKIVEMCNDLLTKDEQTRIHNLQATTYSVIPLGQTGGIIEFMDGVQSYAEALHKYIGSMDDRRRQWKKDGFDDMIKENKLIYFREKCCKDTKLVMAKWFRQQYPEVGKWFASRKLFAKSTAVMSMIGYIFGLGDRHTKNLMIHLPTGKCVHVDFDNIFGKGEVSDIPEVVPFRLTRNMINGMGQVALEGEFRVVCEHTLRVMKENAYEIEKFISDLPSLVSDWKKNKSNKEESYSMQEAKNLVSGRLRGQIMTVKIHPSNSLPHPMKVSQLASSLIELATCEERLSQMFSGWLASV